MSLTLALYLAVYTSSCPRWVLLAFGTGNYSGASLLYLAAMLALVPGGHSGQRDPNQFSNNFLICARLRLVGAIVGIRTIQLQPYCAKIVRNVTHL